jgi:hypothetical protein
MPVPTPGLTTYYAAQGAWLGSWTPFLWQDRVSTEVNTGYARLGMGLGAAAAMGLAPLAQGEPERLVGQTAGFTVGSMVGFGISSLFMREPTRQAQAIGVLGGAIGGEVLGGWLAPRFQTDPGALTFVAGLETWAGYQSLGWAIWAAYTEGLDHQREIGLPILAFGLGSGVATVMPTLVDLEPSHTMAALSAGAWGSAYGNWISFLAQTTPQDNLRNMLVAGDVALAAGLTASLIRPVDTRQLALINGLGLAGATVGGLAGIAINGEPTTSTLSTAIGATVGLAGGTALAVWRGAPAPAAESAFFGPRRPRWLPAHSPVTPSLLASPWFDEEGGTGAMIQLTLMERE